jgi:hypothetical protein
MGPGKAMKNPKLTGEKIAHALQLDEGGSRVVSVRSSDDRPVARGEFHHLDLVVAMTLFGARTKQIARSQVRRSDCYCPAGAT